MREGMLGNNEVLRQLWGGPLWDLVSKLNGGDGSEWEKGLKKFLRKEDPWESDERKQRKIITPPFQVWKTIKLGTVLVTTNGFRGSLKQCGCSIGGWAEGIIDNMPISRNETEVGLVDVSVAELGFGNGTTRRNIYERALKLGLGFPSSEVGPQLRLQYNNQPEGKRLYIGMKPVKDSFRNPLIFYIERLGASLYLLDGIDGEPNIFWSSDTHWIFLASLDSN